MRIVYLVALLVGQAAAQNLSGPFHFVQMSVRAAGGESGVEVRNAGGTINFDGSGGYRMVARVGQNGEPMAEVDRSGTYEVRGSTASVVLTNPILPEVHLEARYNDGLTVLLGTSRDSDEFTYDLFVAVQAGQKASPALLDGEYAAAYMVMEGGAPAGLATGFVRFAADGQGAVKGLRLIGHAAAVDDVDRPEKFEDTTYTIAENGAGTLDVAGPSDVLRGEKQLLVSAGGDWILGFSTADGRRDILVGVRRQREAATFSFNGMYSFAELHAENDFVFDPNVVRFANSSGVLSSDAGGKATLSQRVRSGGRRTHLTTVNQYLISSNETAMLGRTLSPKVDNLALAMGGQALVGAQVGAADDLTLDHGIFVGIRAAAPAGGEVVLPVTGVVNTVTRLPGPVAPGGWVSLVGMNLAKSTQSAPAGALPAELAGVKVLFNGQPAGIRQVAPHQVDVVAPGVSGTSVVIQVENNGRSSAAIEVPLAASSPAILDTPQPAKPGDKIVLTAIGLGAVEPAVEPGTPAPEEAARLLDAGFRVSIGGQPAEVSFAGLAPGAVGQYQIQVTVPADLAVSGAVPVAIETTGAYNDLGEITVRRP